MFPSVTNFMDFPKAVLKEPVLLHFHALSFINQIHRIYDLSLLTGPRNIRSTCFMFTGRNIPAVTSISPEIN